MENLIKEISFEMVRDLCSGESISLDEQYEIYHYECEDCIVVMDSSTYEEKLTVLIDYENKSLIFEEL